MSKGKTKGNLVVVTAEGKELRFTAVRIYADDETGKVSVLGGEDGRKLLGKFHNPKSVYFTDEDGLK